MTNPIRIFLRCFATASVIVGPLAGLVAIGFAIYTSNFIHHASRAQGTITKLTSFKENDNTETFAPTFTFNTTKGSTITKVSSMQSNPPGFTVGEHVSILFDPNNEQHAEIDTFGPLWFVPILLGAFFLAFTTAGVLLLRRPQIATTPIPFWTTSSNV